MYEGSLYEGGEGAYFLPYIPARSCHGECPHGEDIRCIKTCLIPQQSIHRIISYLLHYQLVAEQAIRMLRYAVFDLPCRFHPPPPRLSAAPPLAPPSRWVCPIAARKKVRRRRGGRGGRDGRDDVRGMHTQSSTSQPREVCPSLRSVHHYASLSLARSVLPSHSFCSAPDPTCTHM